MIVEDKDFVDYIPKLKIVAKKMNRIRYGDTGKYSYDLFTVDDLIQDIYIKFHKLLSTGYKFDDKKHLESILVKLSFRVIFHPSSGAKKKYYGHGFITKGNQYTNDKYSPYTVQYNLLPDEVQPTILNEYILKENVDTLYKEIHSLKYKNDIDALLLYVEGYNIEEIAEKLNRSYTSITSSLYRVKKELKHRLDLKQIIV